MRKIMIDISWPITEAMTTYKNRGGIVLNRTKTVEHDGAAQTSIAFDSHTGTHIDAPAHFIADGTTIDQISLDVVNGVCQVLDCTQVTACITKKDLLSHAIVTGEIILFKTRNSLLDVCAPFDINFVYLAHDAADYLVECNVKAVGIDYLGIERNQPGHKTHKSLLGAGIPIIEGLRLAHVDVGRYQLICLPLSMSSCDAAPARAVLNKI